MKAIEAIDDSGKVQRFASIRVAAQAGFSRKLIHDCLAGRQAQHRGLTWRYGDAPQPAPKQAGPIQAPPSPRPAPIQAPPERSLIDSTDKLPVFLATRCTPTGGNPVYFVRLTRAFEEWLPEGEICNPERALEIVRGLHEVELIDGKPRTVTGLFWK